MNGPSDYLSRADLGMACEAFKKKTDSDPFWEKADYKSVVLFWCSDLKIVHTYLPWARRSVWTVVSPSGKRVVTASSPIAAWRFSAAVIHHHLCRVRKERECQNI